MKEDIHADGNALNYFNVACRSPLKVPADSC